MDSVGENIHVSVDADVERVDCLLSIEKSECFSLLSYEIRKRKHESVHGASNDDVFGRFGGAQVAVCVNMLASREKGGEGKGGTAWGWAFGCGRNGPLGELDVVGG